MYLSYTHMNSTSPTVFSAFIGCAFLDMSEMTTHFSKEKKKNQEKQLKLDKSFSIQFKGHPDISHAMHTHAQLIQTQMKTLSTSTPPLSSVLC